MLTSIQPVAKGKNRPVFAMWIGNFYEPYFSDLEACQAAVLDMKDMGLNSIILDSKVWDDFTRYFETGEASPYVQTQLQFRAYCEQAGMGISFLALFAIGDNLYPHIYPNPPEFVQQPTDVHGNPIRGYRHWSAAQRQAHVTHCLNLYRHIARGEAAVALDEAGQERWPFYFYHSPVFSPSFDADGKQVYLNWLKARYTAQELEERYRLPVTDIDRLEPADYWVHPERTAGNAISYMDIPAAEDYAHPVCMRKYADNMAFKYEVMDRYFAALTREMKEQEPRFYLYSALTQWKYLFTESPVYDAGKRALDIWRLGASLDSPSFTTMPADVFGEPDVYVVSCELAMCRSAAQEQDFVGGLFMGRKPNADLYGLYSPAEIVATAFGTGATDLYFYGYSGLDDGGNVGKWAPEIKQSLREGLDWFTKVRAIAGKRLSTRKAAIVFPYATFTLGVGLENFKALRHDVLGWYRQLADAGLNADILHPEQVKHAGLADYEVVVLPADPLYAYLADAVYEKQLQLFLENGGMLLASASAGLGNLDERGQHGGVFDIERVPREADTMQWQERILVHSPTFCSFKGTFETLATYLSDGTPAIVRKQAGRGEVYLFGMDYGYSYIERQHKTVPFTYGNDNQYPLSVLKETPVEALLSEHGLMARRHRGVERIVFEHGVLYLNHTPYVFYPEEVQREASRAVRMHCTYVAGDAGQRCILPHQAAFVQI